jgi:hypothetical protein
MKSVLYIHTQMVFKLLGCLVVTEKVKLKSQPALGTIFRGTCAIESRNKLPRRGLLVRFSELVTDFIEASINFIFDSLH